MKRDFVIPMSCSSIIAAEAYADEFGVEFNDDAFGLWVFILTWNATTADIMKLKKMIKKAFYMRSGFEKLFRKRVVIVDDSLVRASSFDLLVVFVKQYARPPKFTCI